MSGVYVGDDPAICSFWLEARSFMTLVLSGSCGRWATEGSIAGTEIRWLRLGERFGAHRNE